MILDLFKRKADPLDAQSREVLDLALVQRAKIDLEFDPGVTTLKGISCALSSVGETQLIVDVYGLREPAERFVGARMTGHFRIREGRGNTGFFAFTVRVTRMAQGKNGSLFFVTTLPDKVERSQRRRSLRMRPETERFADLRIWMGRPATPAVEAPPLVTLEDLRRGKACRLENLSAGGMGLSCTREFCRERRFETETGSLFAVYIEFAEDVRNQPRVLWLEGRAVRVRMDPVSHDLDLGLEFERVATPGPEGDLRLSNVEDNVVREMSERLFEWHLRQNRSRGLRVD